jgi:hypothetical protein
VVARSIEMDVDLPRGERQWPAALAIVVLIAIPFLLPKQVFPRVLWATAPIEIALLAALAIAGPYRTSSGERRRRAGSAHQPTGLGASQCG